MVHSLAECVLFLVRLTVSLQIFPIICSDYRDHAMTVYTTVYIPTGEEMLISYTRHLVIETASRPPAVISLQLFFFFFSFLPRVTGWPLSEEMKRCSFNEIHLTITSLAWTHKDGVSSAKCHFESAGNRECSGRAKVQLQMLLHISRALSELNCSPVITVM